MLWNNLSVYYVNKCDYDWCTKPADWKINEKDKVRLKSKTENDGIS